MRESKVLGVKLGTGLERRAKKSWETVRTGASDGKGVGGAHETGQDDKEGRRGSR